jgi:hypothetical protein
MCAATRRWTCDSVHVVRSTSSARSAVSHAATSSGVIADRTQPAVCHSPSSPDPQCSPLASSTPAAYPVPRVRAASVRSTARRAAPPLREACRRSSSSSPFALTLVQHPLRMPSARCAAPLTRVADPERVSPSRGISTSSQSPAPRRDRCVEPPVRPRLASSSAPPCRSSQPRSRRNATGLVGFLAPHQPVPSSVLPSIMRHCT